MDLGLTKRQQEIFDFIKKYSARYGYPPTVREIGKAVGLHSSSTVHAHLANLEKVGLLRRDRHRGRRGRRRSPADPVAQAARTWPAPSRRSRRCWSPSHRA